MSMARTSPRKDFAKLHHGEMVIPRHQAEPLREHMHRGYRPWWMEQQSPDQGNVPGGKRGAIDSGIQLAQLAHPIGSLGAKSEQVHKVEGSGKIDVNVAAPKGTNVKAAGGGMFNTVKVNRQSSMPHVDEQH